MNWWNEKPFRMIQNNLRDIDAEMDVDYEVRMLKELGANVVEVGCGGISAFSATALPFQRKSPYLKNDKFGEIVEKCHANQIRVIARFDVSKAHKSFLATNPEWFSRTADGSPIYFEDCAATCVNGDYQMQRTPEMIAEVVRNYPVDGIFFNMPGYQTKDYDNNYVGICQCEACKRRFKALSGGMELPTVEDTNDPVFRKYQEFKVYTVAEMLQRVRKTVKEINPDVAVSTYSDTGIDIIRNEAQSAVDKPNHFWLYSASDDSASIRNTFADKVASTCAINAVDIPYRFQGVSTYMNQMRLYQNMAVGSNLDWCIIGSFEDYPDRANYEGVKQVFHLQARHEALFAALRSTAKVLLVNPQPFYQSAMKSTGDAREYRGLVYMMKEAHIQYDSVILSETEQFANRLDGYDVVLLPDIRRTPGPKFRKALQTTTATVVGTGHTFQENPELVQALFGVRLRGNVEKVRGSYLKTTPKSLFRSFPLRDWVIVDGEVGRMELAGAEGCLPYIGAASYAPPERAFGYQLSGDSMAAIYGKNLYLPWNVGTLYYTLGYEDHKRILLDLLDAVRPLEQPYQIEAPNCAEVFFQEAGPDSSLVQIINLSGFNGTTMAKPLPLEHLCLTLSGRTPKKLEQLTPDGLEELPLDGPELLLRCPGMYAGYKITY